MDKQLYYVAPSDKIFEEVKKACIQVWTDFAETDSYRKEKIERVEQIKNVKDNMMFMLCLFDIPNLGKVANLLNNEALKAIRDRLESVSEEEIIEFFKLAINNCDLEETQNEKR